MQRYWKIVRQFDRSVLLFFLYWAVIGFAYLGVNSVLMNLYLLRLGYGPEFLGLLIGTGQLAWAVFAIPAGAVGARIGPRNAMVWAHIIVGVAMLCMLLVESLPQGLHIAGLFTTWIILWVGAALNTVNSVLYLMAVTTDENRGHAFAMQQAIVAVFAFLGSLAAGFLPGALANLLGVSLEQAVPYRIALILTPVTYLLGAAVFSRARPVTIPLPQNESGETQKAPYGVLVFLGLVVVTQAFSDGTVRAFFNVYLDQDLQVSTAQIGAVMGVSQLLPVAAALITPLLVARSGAAGAHAITTLGASSSLLLIALVRRWGAAAVGFAGMNSVGAMITTARSILSQELVSVRWRTISSAVLTIGMAVGWSTAATFGGYIIERVGFQGLFLLGSASALVSTGLVVLHVRAGRKPVPVPLVRDRADC